MTECDVSIVIVNWNSREFLRRCLLSIQENTSGLEYEIIVVDSGSYDGSDVVTHETCPQAHFIQSPDNVGFARANNIGAKAARGDVLLLLNPDTELRNNAIDELHGQLQGLHNPGIVGCRLLNSDGTLQTSCVQPMPTILNQVLDLDVLQRSFQRARFWVNAATYENERAPVTVEAVSGACMMIRRELFESIQGFSNDYFMYAEDLDLCWKVRKVGCSNYYVRGTEIVHHGGGSTQYERSRFSEVMIPESLSRFLRKSRGRGYSLAYRLALGFAAVFRLGLLLLLLPVAAIRRGVSQWSVIFRKWVAILRWSIGMEAWVKSYGQP